MFSDLCSLPGNPRNYSGHNSRASATSVFRKHQSELYGQEGKHSSNEWPQFFHQISVIYRGAGVDQLLDLLYHEIVEMGMETVDRAVDSHGHVVQTHFVDKNCHSGAGQIGCSSGNQFANVSNAGAIFVRCFFEAQLLEDQAAPTIITWFVTWLETKKKSCFMTSHLQILHFPFALLGTPLNSYFMEPTF